MKGKKGVLVMAALAGLVGSGAVVAGCASSGMSSTDKHSCKGMNACKGQGGCAVPGKNACKGMNECRGMGGCATDGSHRNSCSSKSGDPSQCGKSSCSAK